MNSVDFFIVGAPKCGTTAMYSYLKSNPSIFLPERKEPHYFGSDLDFHAPRRITFVEYLKLFDNAKPNQVLGDASVFYLMSENAAEEIKAYNPEAKIVIMLRNPIDVMHSFHSQRLFNGTEDIESFIDAIAAEQDRREGRRMPSRIGLRQGLFYRDVVMFADQVKRYIETFGRTKVHIILYEDFVLNIARSYQNLCSFLEIDETSTPNFDPVNTNKVASYPWLLRMLKSPPEALSLAGRIVLPSKSLRRSLKKRVRKFNTVTQPRTPIPPEVRLQLSHDLRTSIDTLEQLLERKLDAWR